MKPRLSLILILLLAVSLTISGEVKLPKLISDGMVLQRETDVNIWGRAAVNEPVTVSFIDSVYVTKADNKGEWKVTFSDLKAGGPYTMNIISTDTIVIKDILVGDVWICSGQSNMEISMKRASPIYKTEIANSENPFIRYFEVSKRYDFNTPQKDIANGQWLSAGPDNILKFSAVCYFFAFELYNKYKIPVGLINASLGGSPAEAWMSEKALKAFPVHYKEAQKFKDSSLIDSIKTQDRIRFNKWYSKLGESDTGYKNPYQIQ